MRYSDNEIEIKYVMEVLNDSFPGYHYSILEIDAPMPDFFEPTWEEIDTEIKEKKEGYLLSEEKLTKVTKSFSDIYDFVIVADKSSSKLQATAAASKDQFEFMDKAFFCLIIEDSQIYQIRCEDKFIEAKLIEKLGPIYRFVVENSNTNN